MTVTIFNPALDDFAPVDVDGRGHPCVHPSRRGPGEGSWVEIERAFWMNDDGTTRRELTPAEMDHFGADLCESVMNLLIESEGWS